MNRAQRAERHHVAGYKDGVYLLLEQGVHGFIARRFVEPALNNQRFINRQARFLQREAVAIQSRGGGSHIQRSRDRANPLPAHVDQVRNRRSGGSKIVNINEIEFWQRGWADDQKRYLYVDEIRNKRVIIHGGGDQ